MNILYKAGIITFLTVRALFWIAGVDIFERTSDNAMVLFTCIMIASLVVCLCGAIESDKNV